jgi:hypothetical protein
MNQRGLLHASRNRGLGRSGSNLWRFRCALVVGIDDDLMIVAEVH